MNPKLHLNPEEIKSLKIKHKTEANSKIRDRIKALLLLNDGFCYKDISKILLIDNTSVRRHVQKYLFENKLTNEHKGGQTKLKKEQSEILIRYLQDNPYSNVKVIIDYVKEQFNIVYTVSGLTNWLKKNNFAYKKLAKPIKIISSSNENGATFYYGYSWIYKGNKYSKAINSKSENN